MLVLENGDRFEEMTEIWGSQVRSKATLAMFPKESKFEALKKIVIDLHLRDPRESRLGWKTSHEMQKVIRPAVL